MGKNNNNNKMNNKDIITKTLTNLPVEVCDIIYEYYKPHTFFVGVNKFDYNGWEDYTYKRTFMISKITKCYVHWIEINTNCWNNNHKVSKSKKYFCNVRNCEYFKDNTYGILYANKTFIR
jgi:hypothetical protein